MPIFGYLQYIETKNIKREILFSCSFVFFIKYELRSLASLPELSKSFAQIYTIINVYIHLC